MKNVVVLTGSFNPITKAHRFILESAINKIDAEFGLLVTTNDRYLTKKNLVDNKTPTGFHLSEEIRKEMIDSLTTSFPKVRYGGIELGNESPSTVRTLLSLAKKYKEYRLFYMIGADKLHGVSHWTNFDSLFHNFGLIVFPRDGYDIPSIISNDPFLSTHKDMVVVMDKIDDTSGVSSTLIRNKFFSKEDYKEYMDEGPYKVLSRYTPSDFPNPTSQDVITATIKYGGRFGGNAARIKVFKENKKLFDNWDNKLFGNKSDVINNTKVYKTKFVIPKTNTTYNTSFDCVNMDCVDAAKKMIDDGYRPVILNLASNVSPCGGYHKGSNAQEESISYSSNLSVSLYQFGSTRYKHIRDYHLENKPGVYPMDINYGGIYSKDITFFRNNIDNYYSLKESPFKCSVISVSSLSNREQNEYTQDETKYFNIDGTLNVTGKEIEENKIRTILRIGLDNNHDSIILGAFGCGVYHLLPEEISKMFHNILNEDEFKNRFKKVVFAIYEGKGSARKVVGPKGKFKSFYDIFSK